jgi:hypothetical protein
MTEQVKAELFKVCLVRRNPKSVRYRGQSRSLALPSVSRESVAQLPRRVVLPIYVPFNPCSHNHKGMRVRS